MRKRAGTGSRAERVDIDLAWSFLLAIRAGARQGESIPTRFGLGYNSASTPAVLEGEDPGALITVESNDGWTAHADLHPEAASMLDLYLPVALACARRPLVVAHLGVSLDGHIATHTGASHYITGPENIVHLHRLRALADAVIVGAGTVEQDDPQLTTRRVTGNNAVRVVMDPARRLGRDFRVFSDDAAETLIFCAEDLAGPPSGRHGTARIIGIPAGPSGLSLDALLERLRSLQLHSILVEGGGITVSRFLNENKLDRLQLAVAPLIIGSGRPGLVLPPIDRLAQALRPRCRHFRMGLDMLFDCDLRSDRR
jgi:diaminohydroxyphosphoribosylaminopyrimidine deaminase / 5-amino-6-(5-phosphoribosylamino)uracil reductase